MSKFVEGIVARLYKGYRLSIKEPDNGVWEEWVVVGSRKIRKNYNYIIERNGVKNSLNRDIAMRLMERGDIKVYSEV